MIANIQFGYRFFRFIILFYQNNLAKGNPRALWSLDCAKNSGIVNCLSRLIHSRPIVSVDKLVKIYLHLKWGSGWQDSRMLGWFTKYVSVISPRHHPSVAIGMAHALASRPKRQKKAGLSHYFINVSKPTFESKPNPEFANDRNRFRLKQLAHHRHHHARRWTGHRKEHYRPPIL